MVLFYFQTRRHMINNELTTTDQQPYHLLLLKNTKMFSSHGDFLTYTTLTNLNTKYLVMCNVYTDVGGVK